MHTPAILLLADGTIYNGFAAGKIGTTTGELCFNTTLTGYQEVFSDPSYKHQLLIATNVHVGNYATKATENESDKVQIAGLICRNFTNEYSRPQADTDLQNYLEQADTVAITGIDTRALTRHIRQVGTMNAVISSETTDIATLKKLLAAVPNMEGLELASKVSTTQSYTIGNPAAPRRVAVMDYGTKQNILNAIAQYDCYIKIFAHDTPLETIMKFEPHGILLSNGPGDPAAMHQPIIEIQKMLAANIPIFGICLGHQLLCLAAGLQTYKMKQGHRGANHPVKNLQTGKCEITSQNHGFAVSYKSATNNENIEITHINLNDNTIEGIKIKNKPAFSVQHHPEAAPGPHDASYLFGDFVEMMTLHNH
jgi:carbamoyl-phosphate synthase small subunit